MRTNDFSDKSARRPSVLQDAVNCARKRSEDFRKEESGSIIIFSLFLLIILLFTIGFAVDTMRYETKRVAMQGTLDNAILAASSLTQDLDAEAVVLDHVAKAGLNPKSVKVNDADTYVGGPGGTLVARRVSAQSKVEIDTFFLNMLGIETLAGYSGGGAYEAVQNIEISLVVDISGSMGSNDRLVNLKKAAVEFFTTVLQNNAQNSGVTSISIIPYNATVVVGDPILSRLNASGTTFDILSPLTIPGALTSYLTEHDESTCVRFQDDDFMTRAISPTTSLVRVANFDEGSNGYKKPGVSRRWCDESRSPILAHSTSLSDLTTHINGLKHGGWTGVDNGVKWGVALLDPEFRPVINSMVDASILSEDVRNRPGPYDEEQTMKILVVMTDGANTLQRDLKPEYKNGPTRVWFSESKTKGSDGPGGRARTEFDGYHVLMPDKPLSERWYVPGDPSTTSDDQYLPLTSLPLDAIQQDYLALYERFAVDDVARFFFGNADPAARDAHLDAVEQHDSYGQIDARLSEICKQARVNNDIEIFAIGFEAPYGGQQAMEDCASGNGNYYDVKGTEISKAFASIAGKITSLRLTQ